MTVTTGRTATFVLRQPRQVHGFREVLTPGNAQDAYVEGDYVDDGYAQNVAAAEGISRAQPLALTMLWIPPGRFWMGSPETELERGDSEGPQHLVQLQGFFMSQTPITQAQWRRVATWTQQAGEEWGRELEATPSWFDGEKQKLVKSSGRDPEQSVVLDGTPSTALHPVERVSWHDAIEFCHRLSQRTGRHYTLPSEAQWEYACRAGTSTPFHVGATITPDLANYDGTVTFGDGPKGAYRQQTTPVGLFPANAWGLHDMHGNVLEWCLDHWHESYQGAPSDGSAWLNPTALSRAATTKKASDSNSDEELRLLRGGSWDDDPRDCRSASRYHGLPDFANVFVGFRVVCLPQSPSLNPQSINPSTLAVA